MTAEGATTEAVAAAALTRELEEHRRELTGYCYRMLGSGGDAEDAVQETMVKAWRAHDGFEGRSSLRSWLFRIATNVCLDMLRGPQRRARPMDLGPSVTVETAVLAPQPEHRWVQPIADGKVIETDADPGQVTMSHESIRLAFVAALQHLPPRQRAALILCEVLRWSAAEAAELLETSVPAVNSALQRARATMATIERDPLDSTLDPAHQELLARYVDAFERYDMTALTALLHEDAVITMPPFDIWLRGADQVVGWMLGPGIACKGSRLIPVQACGTAGFGSYKPGDSGRLEPWALQVIDVRHGRITGHHNFIFPELFEQFGLPPYLDA